MTDNGPHFASPQDSSAPADEPQSIGQLIGSITDQFSRLLRAEVASLKKEFTSKATKSAMGIGLFVVAGVLALYGLGFLFWSAATAIALALPLWLSTLLVAVGIFILAAILALVGKRLLAKHAPPVPTETITSIKQDVAVIKEGIK